MYSKLSISQKLYLSFAIIVVLLGILIISAYRGFGQVDNAINSNVHSYQVLTQSQTALEQLINIETGILASPLPARTAFLSLRSLAKPSFPAAWRR